MDKLNFYEKLEDMLADRHISKSELAKRIGVSRVTMTNWCSGRIIPRRENLIKICQVLDVPVSDFIDCDEVILSDNEKWLVDFYRALETSDQEVLLQFLQKFKEKSQP